MPKKKVYLDGETLTTQQVLDIAQGKCLVEFTKTKKVEIRQLRAKLMRQLHEQPWIIMYGTNVGCGDLKNAVIGPEWFETYQVKYIKAHNCGTGKPLPEEVVRAMMVIRLNSFARGVSGMRMETCQLLIDMLNKGVTPLILEEGSVGASGDLVPLAMMGGVMIGLPQARAYYRGKPKPMKAPEALAKAGLKPAKLSAKEAMGLTNGANLIAALAVFALHDAESLLKNASVSAALALEAIRGEHDAFSPKINRNRPHKGQLVISGQMRKLLRGSVRSSQKAQMDFFTGKESETKSGKARKPERVEKAERALAQLEGLFEKPTAITRGIAYRAAIADADRYIERGDVHAAHRRLTELVKELNERSKKKPEMRKAVMSVITKVTELISDIGTVRVQDRYSLRAVPPVHGAVYEALEKLRSVLEIEINSATDNPLFFEEAGTIVAKSGANFHGQPLAAVIDYVKATIAALGVITDKRIFSLLDERLSYGLPSNLADDATRGDTGLMLAQYATAARAADSRVLSMPASVMSISTSGSQEDFVSMGSIGVLHLRKIIYNTRIIVAVELLCALRALQQTKDYLPPHLRKLGKGTGRVFEFLAGRFRNTKGDRFVQTDMDAMIEKVTSGEIVKVVEAYL